VTTEDVKILLASALEVHEKLAADADIHFKIEKMSQMCLSAINAGGKVIFAGNGGSFADAQHLTAEFVSRLQFDRDPLPAIALGTNSSSLTAIGNDYGFDQIFSRELSCLGAKTDVFIPISTSGNSENIIRAIGEAKKIGMSIIGLTGANGGEMSRLCDFIQAPSFRTERIQECHILIGHVVCALVEDALFKPNL